MKGGLLRLNCFFFFKSDIFFVIIAFYNFTGLVNQTKAKIYFCSRVRLFSSLETTVIFTEIVCCFELQTSAPSPIKLAWNNLYLMLSFFSSSVYRRTLFYCTSTNHTGSTHRVQQNWAVAGFEEDCVGKRFCNFWQSRRGKLHVFCTFRTAWPYQRNQNLPWWVTPNYCSTPSGKPKACKHLILFYYF